MFIMIEGTDGSGKSVQTELLRDHLSKMGRAVEVISFPRYGQKSAIMVEEYLAGNLGSLSEGTARQASIFYAVDRFAAKKQILQWLGEGKIVISNRYVGSNMGHQGGKMSDPEERKKFFEWNYDLEYNIFQIPRPDVNIILHVKAETAEKLINQRAEVQNRVKDIHEKDLNHLKNAETAYLHMAEIFPEFQLVECEDGERLLSTEEIHGKIWMIIQNKFN